MSFLRQVEWAQRLAGTVMPPSIESVARLSSWQLVAAEFFENDDDSLEEARCYVPSSIFMVDAEPTCQLFLICYHGTHNFRLSRSRLAERPS